MISARFDILSVVHVVVGGVLSMPGGVASSTNGVDVKGPVEGATKGFMDADGATGGDEGETIGLSLSSSSPLGS